MRWKGDFSEFLEELLFEISTKLQNAEIFLVTLLKSASIIASHPIISKILGTLAENICGGFSLSMVIGGWTGEIILLKWNATLDVFPGIFQNFYMKM